MPEIHQSEDVNIKGYNDPNSLPSLRSDTD